MIDRTDRPLAGPAPLDVDRLLRAFYQAEMPDPWPRLALPDAAPARRPARRPARNFWRFALAASVVLGLLAYWGVAGMFPAGPLASELDPVTGQIGSDPLRLHPAPRSVPSKHLSPVEQTRTPGGNDAQVFEEETPQGQVITIIGPSHAKGPR